MSLKAVRGLKTRLMALRTYFWSLPEAKEGRLRFSLALTSEMCLPLPLDFAVDVWLQQGREWKALEDLKVRTSEVCGGTLR